MSRQNSSDVEFYDKPDFGPGSDREFCDSCGDELTTTERGSEKCYVCKQRTTHGYL